MTFYKVERYKSELDVGQTGPYGNVHVASEIMDVICPTVIFRGDATVAEKRSAVMWLEGLTDILARIGWYDHTNDWDFHHEVELIDGRILHEDGSTIHIDVTGDMVSGIEEDKQPTTFWVDMHAAPDDEWDYEFRDKTLWEEFGKAQNGSFVMEFPLDQVRRISFGYCS